MLFWGLCFNENCEKYVSKAGWGEIGRESVQIKGVNSGWWDVRECETFEHFAASWKLHCSYREQNKASICQLTSPAGPAASLSPPGCHSRPARGLPSLSPRGAVRCQRHPLVPAPGPPPQCERSRPSPTALSAPLH